MSNRGYSSIIHMVGLGGAGTNIVEQFMKDEKTLELLGQGSTRLSMMAMDIADPDIKSLDETYNKILDQMRRNGVPQDRLNLIARSVKFPSAEAMFDFVQNKFEEHLRNEGIQMDEYNPWLPSTVAIPPLAGGAGRRRSLAKAIYNLELLPTRHNQVLHKHVQRQRLEQHQQPNHPTGVRTRRRNRKRHGARLCTSPTTSSRLRRTNHGTLCTTVPRRRSPRKGATRHSTAINELSLLLNREKNALLTHGLGEVYRKPLQQRHVPTLDASL